MAMAKVVKPALPAKLRVFGHLFSCYFLHAAALSKGKHPAPHKPT